MNNSSYYRNNVAAHEIWGRVIWTGSRSEGTSKNTGNPWKSLDFVIEAPFGDSGVHRICFRLFGKERCDAFDAAPREGMNARVWYSIDAKEYQGRWFNNITADRVSFEEARRPAYENRNNGGNGQQEPDMIF